MLKSLLPSWAASYVAFLFIIRDILKIYILCPLRYYIFSTIQYNHLSSCLGQFNKTFFSKCSTLSSQIRCPFTKHRALPLQTLTLLLSPSSDSLSLLPSYLVLILISPEHLPFHHLLAQIWNEHFYAVFYTAPYTWWAIHKYVQRILIFSKALKYSSSKQP